MDQGDSLTHGMHHPYTQKLNVLMNQHFGLDLQHSFVINAGKSGEVTAEMVARIGFLVQKNEPKVVVVLGGTNDLGHLKPHHSVIENIQQIHEIARTINKKPFFFTIAMTIPEIGWPFVNQTERLQVNNGIRDYVSRTGHTFLLDLECAFFNQSNPTNDKYWASDKVHFKPAGYDVIGELVFNVLKNSDID